MKQTKLALFVMVMAVMLGSSSCGEQGGASWNTRSGGVRQPIHNAVPASPPVLALPEVSAIALALTRPRRAAFSEADLRREAAAFVASLPHNRITPAESMLVFSPNFAAADSGLEAAAYALYGFSAASYDREPLIQLSWDSPPPAGSLYLGLANFSSLRWDWFQPTDSARLDLPALAPYIAADDSLYAAVVLTGDQPASLASLRLGEAYPSAALSADVLSGAAPLLVAFDASASTAPDSELTLFEWDFDGDGTFDASSDAAPSIQHSFDSAGQFEPIVRVSNSLGHSATARLSVEVLEPPSTDWMHFIGTGDNDYFNAVAVDGEGNIYAAGVSQSAVFGGADALLTKWTAGGAYLWGRLWDLGANYSEALDLAVDSSGNAVVVGEFDAPGPGSSTDGMVLKWAPNGDLSWARCFSADGYDRFSTVSVDGTEIYVTGESESFSSDDDLLILRIAGDSSFVWARRYDWFEERAVEAQLLITDQGAQSIFVLVTETNPAPNPDARFPLWVRYSLDGDFEADGCSATYNNFYAEAFALEYEPLSMVTQLYMTGFEGQAGNAEMVLLATDSAYNGLFCRTWENGQGSRTSGITPDGSGSLLVAGHSDYDAGLWRFSAADGSVQAAQLFVNPDFDSDFQDVLALGNDVLCVGYGQNIASSWQDAVGTQNSFAHTWSLASGLSYSENLTIGDPTGDSTAEWQSPVLDTGGGQDDSIITRRSAP